MTTTEVAVAKFQSMYGAWLPETPARLGVVPEKLPTTLTSSGVDAVGALVKVISERLSSSSPVRVSTLVCPAVRVRRPDAPGAIGRGSGVPWVSRSWMFAGQAAICWVSVRYRVNAASMSIRLVGTGVPIEAGVCWLVRPSMKRLDW